MESIFQTASAPYSPKGLSEPPLLESDGVEYAPAADVPAEVCTLQEMRLVHWFLEIVFGMGSGNVKLPSWQPGELWLDPVRCSEPTFAPEPKLRSYKTLIGTADSLRE